MPSSFSSKKISVTVNGREMQVVAGVTILQALLQANVPVPHLCYDIRLPKSTGNCGLCVVELNKGERDVKACQTPISEGMVITTVSPKLEAYRKVRLEQLLSEHNADCVAPCVTTCPANIDIQSYLAQVVKGNFAAALRVIKERNPFPSVCGRVCPHPCEAQCRRNLVDAPVAINAIKRFAADKDMEQGTPWIPRKTAPSGRKIAIVGAGPSGLTAAFFSALQGHDVTVFERQSEPGGMMRYGIPEYRLPKAVLDAEIGVIRKLGVRILTGKALGTHLRLEDLKLHFDAVYLAIGSWRATPLQIEGESLEGVWLGIHYLEAVIKEQKIDPGEIVAVIGGGNTAIDCARTALRQGARKVVLIYRRTREEMPAEPAEVEEALHEGVEMIFLAAPARITVDGGRKRLSCLRMTLGEPDRSGRRRPVPLEGSEFTVEADTVIGAIGQSTNTQFLYNDLPVELNRWGDIEINGKTMQSSDEKIFAGGDCVTGPATVIQAVAAGRRAAQAMHDYLTRGYADAAREDYSCSRGRLEEIPRYEYEGLPKVPRTASPSLPLSDRLKGFREVEGVLSEMAARDEAARCLQCGCNERFICDLRREATAHGIQHRPHIGELPYIPVVHDHDFIYRDHNKCISCGRCVAACAEIEGPDVLNMYFKGGRMLVGTKSGRPLRQTDCVSCGQCVNACPCGALDYRRERGKVFNAINNPDKMVIGFVAPAVRSAIAGYFNVPYDKASAFVAGLMKKMGFDRVFDFVFAADLTVVEETTEFLNRVKNKGVLPHFTSCCPGWVNFVERRYPDMIPHLSSCKSPQQMMGATIKNHYLQWARLDVRREDIFTVSVVPCIAKKYEAARPEMAVDGNRDVDAVVTTSELIEMFHLARLDREDIAFAEFDEPYRQITGAGVLFGASGGVAEAALRMAAEKVTGRVVSEHLDYHEVRGFAGLKEATLDMGGAQARVAVISGLHNVEPLLRQIREGVGVAYDLIEVMACPGGCICGAGHPVPQVTDELNARQQVLINIDKEARYRKSQENPDILRLYDDYYGEPNSPLAHSLLHTHYASQAGDSSSASGRNMADSAFHTHEMTFCLCDRCEREGAREVLLRLEEQIEAQKLSPLVTIKPLRLRENHGKGLYITLDGTRLEASQYGNLDDLYRLLTESTLAQRGQHG